MLKNQGLKPRSVLLWIGFAFFAVTRPGLSTALDVPLPVDSNGNVVPHTFIVCYQYLPPCYQVINIQQCHLGNHVCFPSLSLFADVVWRSMIETWKRHRLRGIHISGEISLDLWRQPWWRRSQKTNLSGWEWRVQIHGLLRLDRLDHRNATGQGHTSFFRRIRVCVTLGRLIHHPRELSCQPTR